MIFTKCLKALFGRQSCKKTRWTKRKLTHVKYISWGWLLSREKISKILEIMRIPCEIIVEERSKNKENKIMSDEV